MIIQTAFIGDVILATGLVESIAAAHPDAEIDFVLRKGNEGLLENHPKISRLFVWNKKEQKYKNLRAVIAEIRKQRYDLLINVQRFGASGYMSWRAKAKEKVGFSSNPFSFCYDRKVKHEIGNEKHEIERNFELISHEAQFELAKPKLYPSETEKNSAQTVAGSDLYVVMAPSSVWYTKQMHKDKWVELIQLQTDKRIILIGGPDDAGYLDEIIQSSGHKNIVNAAGKLNLLASAALIENAEMTHVNDSAPLHLATATNAAVTAYFCSTIPAFGFGPLSDKSNIRETNTSLSCRPCGLHGKKECPEGHFKCGKEIDVTLS